jgi:hypothetical protein
VTAKSAGSDPDRDRDRDRRSSRFRRREESKERRVAHLGALEEGVGERFSGHVPRLLEQVMKILHPTGAAQPPESERLEPARG